MYHLIIVPTLVVLVLIFTYKATNSKYFKALVERPLWKKYKKILKLFLDNDYQIMGLSEFYYGAFDHTKKVVILRHDVDNDPKAADRMFSIEQEIREETGKPLGSTFYFRWKTVDDALIRKLQANSWEIGLHFETGAKLAMFYGPGFVKKSVKNKIIVRYEDVDFPAEVRKILGSEIDLFRNRFGTMGSICSHGHTINRDLRFTNYDFLTKEFKKSYKIFEAYELRDRVKHDTIHEDENVKGETWTPMTYISDTSSVYGLWKYDTNPYDAVKNGDQIIYFLAHPSHWGRHIFKRIGSKLFHKTTGIDI